MKSKKIIASFCAAAVALSLCACAGKEEKTQLKTVTVSEVTHSVFYAPMYAAIEEGYFRQEGLDIELVNAGGADKVMTAVITGGADIGFAGPEAVVYVCAAGKKDYPRVFARLTGCDGSFLVSRNPEPDFKWEDLKGATILPGRKGGIPYMTLLYCLEKHGLQVGKDVFFDESISFDAMTGAFISGTGDYVTVFEPGATELENRGKGYIVASVGLEGGRVPYTAYFANSGYIEENPELIESFTRAIYKGQQFVSEHTARQVARAVARFFPDSDPGTLEKVIQRYMDIGAYKPDCTMSREDFDRLCRILENAGELDENAPVSFEDIVDNTFAQKVKE